jgi:hypothetical protein
MIPASANYINAIENDSRSFRARFLDSNNTELECNITALTISTGGAADSVAVGAMYNSFITAQVQNLASNVFGRELTLQIGVVTGYDDNEDPVIEYINNGLYTVTETSTAATVTTFSAVGRLSSKCKYAYSTALTYPASIQAVINEIQTQAGITVVAKGLTFTGTISQPITGVTIAEALSIIGQLLGGFVTENYLGQIVIAKYGSGDTYELTEARMKQRATFTESAFTVTGLSCRVTEDDEDEETEQPIAGIVYTYGTPNVYMGCPYMTEALFNAMAPRFVGYSFYPAKVPLTLGNPRLEPWDKLSITDSLGAVRVVPCHLIEHSFDGGYWQTISSLLSGDSDNSDTAVAGPMAKAVEKLNADIFIAQQAIIRRATIQQLEAAIATIDSAYIERAVIGNAEITNFTATKGQIETLLANQFTAEQIQTVLLDFDAAVGNSLNLANLDAKRGTFETLLAGDFTAAEITAIGAAFTTATMSSLVTESLTAQYATISFANIGTETVKELFCNVGLIENAVIQDGRITGTLAGVTVVADLIQANTIVAGDLLVQDPSDSDNYYRINLSDSGLTADEIPAEAMAQYLNGNDIVAHSITTRHITTDDLTGTSGWINLAKGTFEYLNAERGTGVSWDGSEFKILSGAGSGTLPIVAAWIDSSAAEYSATWLTDENGQTITPATETIYLIQNDPHKYQYYLWNGTAYADADLFANSLVGNNIIAAADTANATAAKTSSISYENGELILSDSTSAFAVKITNTKLAFMQGDQEVAFINNNQLFIPYTVVLNAMDVGPWRWMKQEDNNLTLQWIGG